MKRRSVDAYVRVPDGRWGPRRVRVEECIGVLRAEDVYTAALEPNADAIKPGARGRVTWSLANRFFAVAWHVRQNAVWRQGRVFLSCPLCGEPVTRVYLPCETAWVACRHCWGLSYESQASHYAADRFLGVSMASVVTRRRRERRKMEAVQRYADRQWLRERPQP